MSNNKNPNQKQPGEKDSGKFHYNPGNMSGKTIDICKDKSNSTPTRTRNKAVARSKIKSAKRNPFKWT
jgi:hypothetical protein